MLTLKQYQQRALDALRRYFEAIGRFGNADLAFYATTAELTGQGTAYRPIDELPGLPYVCLRLPTGGGKTLLASYSIGITAQELLHSDHPVVLWLVPSNVIRDQTLKALRDRRHPYRQALDVAVGPVAVLDVAEALYVTRPTLDTSTAIVVATMQAFRVEETDGRKVYESSGALMEHFSGLDPQITQALERDSAGVTPFSLANVLRIRRPIVIVDEAHNARTDLSFETLARFHPSAILEFTATPDRVNNPSNVLYSASAAELNSEDMIKLPIRLETRYDWKGLVADAVEQRGRLEELARLERQETGEYLRPLMLLQAQARSQNRQTVTVDVLKKCLVEENHVPDEQIVVATGDERGLDGVDLSSPGCRIRHIITVQALREGWDCPFAYVLCSVAEIGSATQVEQILGRVLRMPRAARKQRPELNLAYAYVASGRFASVANTLADALVQNGFTKLEAQEALGIRTAVQASFRVDDAGADMSSALVLPGDIVWDSVPADVRGRIEQTSDGAPAFRGIMERSDKEKLIAACTTADAKAAVENLFLESQRSVGQAAGRGNGDPFAVPLLAYQQGTLISPFEDTFFLDRAWNLSDCDAALSEEEFPSMVTAGQVGEITITKSGEVRSNFVADLQQQMAIVRGDESWSVAELADWLDRRIQHPDITASESGVFLVRLAQTLVNDRSLPVGALVRERYRLGVSAAAKIDLYRKRVHQQAYQALLLPEENSPIVVSPDVRFTFDPERYPYNYRYAGAYHFAKHYYPTVGDLRDTGEEFQCAQFIDGLQEVRRWVRNLERRPGQSFWFQTSTDRFYPDFVCELFDGRYLVVEYKGEDRWSNEDSTEKRNLGELWERRSGGQCLFVMPRGKHLEAIRAKVGASP